ncbi:MAG: TldD/PmbA family protein [Fusobacteriaceae bacterium]|nr:TldD/PmbA family protein [Fusobacteriaceae bacterium]MBN2838529.1 TldD/PmbA family protein [Fusobacteriaceae bacterium]
MEIKLFIDELFQEAKKRGLKEFEVFYSEGKSFSVKIYNGEIDDYKNSSSTGLSFRAIYKERMGYSYTENFSEDSINLLIDELIGNASIIESTDKETIFKGSNNYHKSLEMINNLSNKDISEKIDIALKMEKLAKELDNRVYSVNHCLIGEGIGKRIIKNSHGLYLENEDNGAYAYINVLVKDGEETRTGFAFKDFDDYNNFDYKKLVEEAVERAISLLGSKSIPSGNYDIIIKNEAMEELLGAMSGIFSAEAVDKGLSKFKDKINTKVANEKISILDNPFMKNGVFKTFDDEGYPTKEKILIESGILKTYLHNLKTAEKFKATSTGNGQKGSYKSSIGIAPYNFYIKNGASSFEELLNKMNNGLILIEFDGIHAGLNSISGDFSLSTRGYLVENGKITKGINGIVLAANFFDLLLNVKEVGNDLKFGFPGKTRIGSPSLLFDNLSVSGE